MITYSCMFCGKNFIDYKSNHRKYCSMKCRNKSWSIILKNNHPRYWLGKHRSEDTRKKISKNNGGFKKGKLSKMWKGGLTTKEHKIRTSIEYNLWRNSILARDSWTCQRCGIRGGNLHAHHKKSFVQFPKLRLAIDNGITFCISCHKKEHKRRT